MGHGRTPSMKEPSKIEGHVCKFGTYCFLNCFGCEIVRLATKEEKAQARRDLKEHRKRLGMRP